MPATRRLETARIHPERPPARPARPTPESARRRQAPALGPGRPRLATLPRPRLPQRRPEGAEQILYGQRGSYAPDFIVEWGGEQLAVETKGEHWIKEDTKAKHAAWRAQSGRLAVIYVSDLLRLRLAADAQAYWNALLHLSMNS